jgi:protein-S-isoprenylcysteine O-methyltransferase Ste14
VENRSSESALSETQRDIPHVLAPPPLIFAAALIPGLLLRRALPDLPLPRPARIGLGTWLLGAGVFIAGWALGTMLRAHTPPEPTKPVTALVTEGPFRFSRNPVYSGMTVAYSGIAILANALSALLLLPAVLLIIQRGVIQREERYLERRFGAAYEEYKARVRRWL